MIRSARPDERSALIELQRRASLMWEEDRAYLLEHPDAIDLPPDQIDDGRVLVFEEVGAVLGFAVVLPRDDGQAQLDGLFVEPDAQGRGIGRRLVEHALERARQGGAVGLTLIANAHALGFYEKCGFQILAEVPTPSGKGVRMTRPLNPTRSG